jgi:calpain-15
MDPNSIKQGQIGDCYFISCLCALAAKPERIHKLFNTIEVSQDGKYKVQLCVNGIWQEIVVDDCLPVHPGTSNLAFGKYLKEGD